MKGFTLAAMLMFIPLLAFAAFTGHNSKQTVSTVAEALKAKDDMHVVLEGKIETRIKKEHYRFSDNTGAMTVEIDDDKWGGVNVSENDKVRLYGETDASALRQTTIDVKRIEIIK